MTFDNTLGNLKKRIFDILDEYSSNSDAVFIASGDKQVITSRIPDAVNSSLIRMYESLPVGIEKAVQRVHALSEIAYDKGIPDGERNVIEFYTPVPDIAVFFRYFGSGNAVFQNADGVSVYTVSCGGSDTLDVKRETVSLPDAGIYRVTVEDNVRILDFSVYENDGKTDTGYLCSINEAAFALPDAFDRFISVEGKCGKADIDKIYISDGFAYMKKSGCGDALSVCYKKKPEVISDTTDDGFTFDLSPLAFEALVCLSASEVCREQDAGKYTRLVYKYNDLCEGLRRPAVNTENRNSFYKSKLRTRW